MIDKYFGLEVIDINRVKELRKQSNLSQEKLAELSGLSRQCIFNVENEKKKSTKSTAMEAIARALGKPVSEIFFITM